MHRLTNILTLLILCALCSSISAQKKTAKISAKVPAVAATAQHRPKTAVIDSLIAHYLFDEALSLIDEGLENQPNDAYADSLILRRHQANKGSIMLGATQKVVFIDSQVVSRERMLQAISIDNSCGKLLSAKQVKELLANEGQPMSTGFINDFGDQLFFSQKASNGAIKLMQANRYGDKWSTPAPLFDLEDNTSTEGFPFMMADGATFYFAAKGEASLGGYDIYATRYDAESGTFLKPENVGMPFNSPANDYLMVYDEVNCLGWFVSDRNQPADKVCVYTFIPDDSRETYEADSMSAKLRSIAALHSIAATQQGNEVAVAEAIERLKQARTAPADIAKTADLNFSIAYGKQYHSLDDFKNAEAKKLAAEWAAQTFRRSQLAALLYENRTRYALSHSDAEQRAIAPVILRQEGELVMQDEHLKTLANQIRALEN